MIMTQRIKVADLPEFDAAPYLDNKAAIAAYLTDILEANDPALLAAALGDIARAHGMNEVSPAKPCTRHSGPMRNLATTPSQRFAGRWG
jgi:probable addiction module antidote protein